MNELDLLKKNWNKTENYPTFSEEKIYAMLHKNSSSAVKWIFIISVIELVLAILLNIYFSIDSNKQEIDFLSKIKHGELITNLLTSISYLIAITFVFLTFRAYRLIQTNTSTKALMSSIFKVRKIVKLYIIINLSLFSILHASLFGYGLYLGLKEHLNNFNSFNPYTVYTIISIFSLVITAIVVGIFWFIYNLFYGRLLKKLKKNYEELKKIDHR
ncbi:hypothetical protein [Flavobacterium sp.]|uniref:hypothetical protein n=1 Tax=Flavobacterium sp. TaxID=239 RepID=UPI003D0E8205